MDSGSTLIIFVYVEISFSLSLSLSLSLFYPFLVDGGGVLLFCYCKLIKTWDLDITIYHIELLPPKQETTYNDKGTQHQNKT